MDEDINFSNFKCDRCGKEFDVNQLLQIFSYRGEIYVMKEIHGIGTFRDALCPACTMKLKRFMEGVELRDE